MSEKPYCDTCQNTGSVDCLCGGDLCICGEEEIPCPACCGDEDYYDGEFDEAAE